MGLGAPGGHWGVGRAAGPGSLEVSGRGRVDARPSLLWALCPLPAGKCLVVLPHPSGEDSEAQRG